MKSLEPALSRLAIMVLPALLSLSLWSQQGSGSMCDLTIHVRMADDRQDAVNVQVQLLNTAGTVRWFRNDSRRWDCLFPGVEWSDLPGTGFRPGCRDRRVGVLYYGRPV